MYNGNCVTFLNPAYIIAAINDPGINPIVASCTDCPRTNRKRYPSENPIAFMVAYCGR